MNIGIINSGGDCAGLNTAIASIVKRGTSDGSTFIGFIKGWEGLLDLDYIHLDLDAVRGISHLGGTILRTTNKGRFAGKKDGGKFNEIPKEVLQLAAKNCEELKLDGLIVIGGDGTLTASTQLSDIGVPIVAVPKTMDNDLLCTDRTFGFSSAVDVAAEAIDRIHTTATSHDRVFLVECMGRHAGWVALHAGVAANANAILLPEFPINTNELYDFIASRMTSRGSSIVVIAEGIKVQDDPHQDYAGSEVKLAGSSDALASALKNFKNEHLDFRQVVLGHTQRGGTPNVRDRILAKRYGIAAYDAFRDKEFGNMVSIINNSMGTVPIKDAIGKLKLITKENSVYKAAQALGVYLN